MPRFAFFESIEVEVLFIRKAGAVEVAGEIAQQVNMFRAPDLYGTEKDTIL